MNFEFAKDKYIGWNNGEMEVEECRNGEGKLVAITLKALIPGSLHFVEKDLGEGCYPSSQKYGWINRIKDMVGVS